MKLAVTESLARVDLAGDGWVQEILGHKDVRATMIYRQVLNKR